MVKLKDIKSEIALMIIGLICILLIILSIKMSLDLKDIPIKEGDCYDRYGNKIKGITCIEEPPTKDIMAGILSTIIIFGAMSFGCIFLAINSILCKIKDKEANEQDEKENN